MSKSNSIITEISFLISINKPIIVKAFTKLNQPKFYLPQTLHL